MESLHATLYVDARLHEGGKLMIMPSNGGNARELFRLDGRRVAFFTQENEAEIWVMENLVAALRESGDGG